MLKPVSTILGLSLFLSACSQYQAINSANTEVKEDTNFSQTINNKWFKESSERIKAQQQAHSKIVNQSGKAKNIILFVGDGMGISTVTAARILDGQLKGMLGEENQFSFEQFPFSGLSKTYKVDAQTPDSAGTMTALISGIKPSAGLLGVTENVQRGQCNQVKDNQAFTALELAELIGKSTGIVSTARITHATPAATYAKSAERNWENISDMDIEQYPQRAECEDIALQLINFQRNLEARFANAKSSAKNSVTRKGKTNGIDVVFGGGRRHFLPAQAQYNSADTISKVEGDRTDNRDLVSEWKSMYKHGQYIDDQNGFNLLSDDTPVLGLFNESHMRYEADRHNDIAGEPALSEMTEKAISLLNNNPKGYFLMVESGRIDHGHHANNAYNALHEVVEFNKAINKAVQLTNEEDTLIIVTADHSHVFSMAGYPKRGNPILGKVVGIGQDKPSLDVNGLPYTTLGYANGHGHADLGTETDADAIYKQAVNSKRVDLANIDTEQPGYHQETLIPLQAETHGGEDVAIYARGPSAHLVTGVHEQNYIFHVMDHAAELTKKAQEMNK